MKFFRYKQVARFNFVGIDDELNNVDSSYYNTKFKLFDNTEINTKLMRFRINSLRDLKLSQNARLILESVFISSVEDTSLEVKHNSNVILRLKNLNDSKCHNSWNDNNDCPIFFSHCFKSTEVTGTTSNSYNFERGISFFNTNPDRFYNFTIPSTFTNNTTFDFELIYQMRSGLNLSTTDRGSFYKFHCSFIICDYDEEELISNDSTIVDYDKYGPHFPLKKSL
jgi:hypothetical protein